MTAPVVAVENLCKSFQVDGFRANQVLRGVNLAVERGSVVGLLGQNGSGKDKYGRDYGSGVIDLVAAVVGRSKPAWGHVRLFVRFKVRHNPGCSHSLDGPPAEPHPDVPPWKSTAA